MTASEMECRVTAWAIVIAGCHRLPKASLSLFIPLFSSVPKLFVRCLMQVDSSTPDESQGSPVESGLLILVGMLSMQTTAGAYVCSIVCLE